MNEERSGRNFIFQKEKEKEKNSNLDRILTIEVVAGRDEYWVEWYLGRVNSFANEVLASLTKRVTLNRRGGVSSHAGGNSIARALLKVTRLTRFLSFRSLGGTRCSREIQQIARLLRTVSSIIIGYTRRRSREIRSIGWKM